MKTKDLFPKYSEAKMGLAFSCTTSFFLNHNYLELALSVVKQNKEMQFCLWYKHYIDTLIYKELFLTCVFKAIDVFSAQYTNYRK